MIANGNNLTSEKHPKFITTNFLPLSLEQSDNVFRFYCEIRLGILEIPRPGKKKKWCFQLLPFQTMKSFTTSYGKER